jgi:SSS family solute:Na+ symporter
MAEMEGRAMSGLAVGLVVVFMLIALLFIIISRYGYKMTKANNVMSFFLGDQTFGPLVSAMTFSATLFSAFVLIGLSGFFYTHGAGSWAYVGFGDTLMVVMIIIFGFPLWLLTKKYGYATPFQYLKQRYESKWPSVVAAAVSVVFLIPYMSLQLVGIGKLLNGLTNGQLPYLFGVFLTMLLCILVTQVGGMRTVVWTDALQGLYMFAIALILAFLFLGWEFKGSLAYLFQRVAEVKPELLSPPGPKGFLSHGMILSLIIMTIFMPVSQIQLSQRYMIIRERKAFGRVLLGTAIVPFIAVFPAMIFGFGGKVLWPNLPSGDMAFMKIMTTYFSWPAIIAGAIAVFAACFSTVDSQVLALGSTVSQDIYKNLSPAASESLSLKIGRWSMVILILITALVSISPAPLIVMLAVASYSFTLQLVPTMMGALYWRRGTATGAVASMLVGVGIMLAIQYKVFTFPGTIDKSLWGLMFGIAAYIIGSLATKPSEKGIEDVIGYLKTLRAKTG